MYVYTQGYIKINTNNRYKIAVYLLYMCNNEMLKQDNVIIYF